MIRSTWTDERLDEFGKRMDERFDRVDERFDHVDEKFDRVDEKFDHVDENFDRVDDRLARLELGIDSNGRAIIFLAVSMSASVIAGFGGIIAVLAAKL